MSRRVGDDGKGASEEAHLRHLASKGHPVAIAALEGPESPAELDYLHGWLLELHGRSGVGMGGMNPLSYGTIAEWSRVSAIVPEPHEVEALFYLDAVMLSPDAMEDKPDG